MSGNPFQITGMFLKRFMRKCFFRLNRKYEKRLGKMNIYLIGYRCTGKSTVGKKLAVEMGRIFIDTDEELKRLQDMDVGEIIRQRGWNVFRDMEADVLKNLNSRDNLVVSTGGGIVLRSENRLSMKKNGLVVWLKAEPDTIYKRMVEDSNTAGQRPPLTSKVLMDEIRETLSERLPLYEAAMDFSVETDEKGMDVICAAITEKLKVRLPEAING